MFDDVMLSWDNSIDIPRPRLVFDDVLSWDNSIDSPMGLPWVFHGAPMGIPWDFRGVPMGLSWGIFKAP